MKKTVKIIGSVSIDQSVNMIQAVNRVKGMFVSHLGEFKEEYFKYCDIHITEIQSGVIHVDAELPNPYYKAPKVILAPEVEEAHFCNNGSLMEFRQIIVESKPHKDIRYGQNLMNELYNYNKKAYNSISGTEADCFSVDARGGAFWVALDDFFKNN